ncbi:toll/interleukin-1 receptor domain-containing protein [Nocardia vaccinii]|uniref:toll/interleukin-1 receptor domain-containing protein n=1 Tax=Nocardia vaccinii TaxID=1822 RepID=UPI00082B21BF|nr:toll/interleukin-1 receptor domain-containing protein [Nocardia vaccinii]
MKEVNATSPCEGANEDFWDDLLDHIREQVLIPVVGPELTTVNADGTEQTLTTLIGQCLVDQYELSLPPGTTTMGEAVAAILRQHPGDRAEVLDELYRIINRTIKELDPAPGDALRNLAAITDLRLFVSTTPDRLLAQALNQVRSHGLPPTREVPFSLNLSTNQHDRNDQAAGPAETVVLSLFGQAASTPQYAIHEEDKLEWLHALLSNAARLPGWLAEPLKSQPMLFVGCEIPDWHARFLLRMESPTRLSLQSKQFFFVCSSGEPSLSDFFTTYCRRTQIRQLQMKPAAFAAELRRRWEESTPRRGTSSDAISPPAPHTPAIFISYSHEDIYAARRLCEAIKRLGGDPWLDERRLNPGDVWEQEILTAIRRTVGLFIPVISANTELKSQAYVFKEWYEAVDQSHSILGRHFIVPVVVDNDYQGNPSRYKRIPPGFSDLQFGRAPGGDPDTALLEMLKEEIRAMRSAEAAA